MCYCGVRKKLCVLCFLWTFQESKRYPVDDFTAAKPSYSNAIASFCCRFSCNSWKFSCDFVKYVTQGAVAKPNYEPINYKKKCLNSLCIYGSDCLILWFASGEAQAIEIFTCRSVGTNCALSGYDCGGVDYVTTRLWIDWARIFVLGVVKQQAIPFRHAGLISFSIFVNVRILKIGNSLRGLRKMRVEEFPHAYEIRN